MLVITYFRLDEIGDPFEAYVCMEKLVSLSL